jgi:hypothetical protein
MVLQSGSPVPDRSNREFVQTTDSPAGVAREAPSETPVP